MIYSPSAFMKDTEIWLRYNERPEPRHHAYPQDMDEYDEERRQEMQAWQSSCVEVRFHDQEAIQLELNKSDKFWKRACELGATIKLDAIADRIEIVNTCSCKLPTNFCPDKSKCDVHLVAVLLPEKSEPDESQEQLLEAILSELRCVAMHTDKQDALRKFIITRRK